MTYRFCSKIARLTTLGVALAVPLAAQWTTLQIAARYDTWIEEVSPGSYVTRSAPINLTPNNFINQSFGDPQVTYGDSGEWFITGYGDHDLGDQSVLDATYVIQRSSNGSFKNPSGPALAFPPGEPGNLGVGPAVAKTPWATVGGFKYFAVLPASDPEIGVWLTWAVSSDGKTWHFAPDNGGVPGQPVSDPNLSLKFIHRSDFAGGTHPGYPACNQNRYLHSVMTYNPSDGYFYLAFGYATDYGGVHATWWRFRWTPTNVWGLDFSAGQPVVERRVGSTYVSTDGTIPTGSPRPCNQSAPEEGWADAAMYPNLGTEDNPAEPMALAQLYKPDGSFDSWLFLYQPVAGYGSVRPTPVQYVKGTSTGASGGEFSWGAARPLLTEAVFDGGQYVSCPNSPSPNAISVNQSGWQADGSPQLYGFIAVSVPGSCSPQLGQLGVLMLRFTLSEAAYFYTLPPCRLLDTRNAPGPMGGPALQAGVARTFQIASVCGVPAGARAISINATVTEASTGGSLRLYASGQPTPTATALSYNAAQTRANNGILSLSSTGAITARPDQAFGTLHFLLDVNGYFK